MKLNHNGSSLTNEEGVAGSGRVDVVPKMGGRCEVDLKNRWEVG